MTELILHDYFRSTASYRVRIALNLKRLDYTRVAVNLVAGEQKSKTHREKNRQAFVPVLLVDGKPITQSMAIIDWLDRTFPPPCLIPEDLAQRASALAQANIIACDIHPLNNLRVLRYLTEELGLDEKAKHRWIHEWIGQGFAALEAMAGEADKKGDRVFLGGKAPNIADVCLTAQIYNARRYNLSLEAFPRLVAIDAACSALEAFQRAHPDNVAPA